MKRGREGERKILKEVEIEIDRERQGGKKRNGE